MRNVTLAGLRACFERIGSGTSVLAGSRINAFAVRDPLQTRDGIAWTATPL